jgi:hypothetical protein
MSKLPLVKPSRRSVFDISNRFAVSLPTSRKSNHCLNEPEARATVHEVWEDKVYFQEGISISPDL